MSARADAPSARRGSFRHGSILRGAVRRGVIRRGAILQGAVLCGAILCGAIPGGSLPYAALAGEAVAAPDARQPGRAGEPPSVETVLERTLERMDGYRSGDELQAFAYRLETGVTVLDGRERARERRQETWEVEWISGLEYRTMVARGGEALPADELRRERAHREAFRREVRARPPPAAETEPGPDDDRTIRIDRRLVERYRWEIVGRETVRQRDCLVLAFEPRSDELPVERSVDRALNRAAGKLWVDAREFEVARIEVRLVEPVRVWLGLLGRIDEFAFRFERGPLDDGRWVPLVEETHVRYRVLFRTTHERRTRRWSQFRPAESSNVAPDAAGEGWAARRPRP